MKHLLFILAVSLVLGCTSNSDNDQLFLLQGAWSLRQVDHPVGHTERLTETGGTLVRLYDGDSVMYQCWMSKTETGLIVRPAMQRYVTLIDKGHGNRLYLEDEDPHPLTIVNDTTIVIQQNGALYTWHRADGIAGEWATEIKNIANSAIEVGGADGKTFYVLSTKERRQASFIHWLWTVIAVIVTLSVSGYVVGSRRRRQLQLQLQQIQETQVERPLVVRRAIESVEKVFFSSDEYHDLQRRIASGHRLKEDEWQHLERLIRKVYPGFISQLRNLYDMSELEYQVCLLIKLRIAPSDIAAVLARDASTISTVRSRLYKKVFARKGGARDWDEFVLSIGV